MTATKTPEKSKAVIVEEKFDGKLAVAMLVIIGSKHKYVNPTFKRLAGLCQIRHNKLQTAK